MTDRTPTRVAFVLTTPDAVGGTERATYHLTAELARRPDLDVSIIGCIREADSPHFAAEVAVPLRHLDDRRGRPPGHEPSVLVDPAWEPAFSAATDRAVAAALWSDRADVVVATTPALFALLVQVAPPGTAVVGVEHRATAARGRTGEPLRLYGHLADALVSLTDAGSEWFARTLGSGAPRLATISNLLPTGFAPRSSLERAQVLAAGRLVSSKQFAHTIRAFATARRAGWRLRILGDGPEREALERLVVRLGVHDHVDLVPFVPAVSEELAKSSMLVVSSAAEGQPLVALEALAAGVPIVSYDCPVGPRSIVDHERNGLLVEPNDVDALSVAMRRLIDDRELRHRLGAGARATLPRFGADTIAAQWHRLLIEVAAGPRRHRGSLSRAVPAASGRHAAGGRSGRERSNGSEPAGVPIVPEGALLLHVGPHKTGTTAIQSALAASRPALSELGVTYPGRRPAPHGAVMNRLGTARGWNDAIAAGSLDGWRQLCVETRTAPGTVVVSSEALCHATVEQAAAIVHELRPGPVTVVVTLRPLERILPSSWQEYVKSGWTTSFDDFLHFVLDDPASPDNPTPTFWQRQDHGAVVSRWADAVEAENVVVVVVDGVRRDALHRTFESLLALPAGTLPVDAGNTNRSLTMAEVELLRQVNLVVRDTVPWRSFNLLLRQGGTTALVERRRPLPDEPAVVLPAWAVERARSLGAAAVERIRATGVRVVGDLDDLVPTTPIAPTADASGVPNDVPIDTIVELVDGLLAKASGQRGVDRRRPGRNSVGSTTSQ